jgi:uncharacterized membrane protein YkoI
MRKLKRILIASMLIYPTLVLPMRAQEKKIQRSDLPPAVQKAVDEQSKGATIKGFSTEVENGKKIYEVELTVNGHGKDVSMDSQGHVLEIEEETPLESLPPAVKEGLTKAAGKGTIQKVESLTKNGKLVAYEAQVKTGTKNSEIQVGPDGKKLAHPE